MPAIAASAYCSGFSDSSLWVTSEPSGRRATMSVKVPPRSIQNCQRAQCISLIRGSYRLVAARAAWSYMAERKRRNPAISPSRAFSLPSLLSAATRQASRTSRYRTM